MTQMTTTPSLMTIAQAARLLREGQLSPLDLVRDSLACIEALNDRFHAFIHVAAESALASARRAEQEIAAGRWLGPLHGIPVGVKDLYMTRDMDTTAHSRVLQHHRPQRESQATQRMARAGAVNMGKLATWEFAFGGPSYDLPWPPAVNPWGDNRDPGGSSSGNGAAIGLGMVMGGLGTDTGGSIRYPSSSCGISGIKPTYGRVSKAGVLPLSFSFDTAGPMARSSEDCALMLQVLAGHDPADPTSARLPVPDYSATLGDGVRGLRIGVLRQFFERDVPADDDVHAALMQALRVLQEQGAELVEVAPINPLQHYLDTLFVVYRSEAFAIHEKDLQQRPDIFGALMLQRLLPGATFTAVDYIQALRRRTELTAEMSGVLQTVDLLAMPTTPAPAATLGVNGAFFNLARPFYTTPFNLTGHPALSLATGFSADGMPLSMQLVGRHFDEATVLRAGHAYESATRWADHLPPPVQAYQASRPRHRDATEPA